MINWIRKTLPIEEIRVNAENPRVITEDEFNKLKDRIERLGFHSVIKVDSDNVILGGNQRFEVLKKLGHKEIEVLAPERELTDYERDEIIITDNTHNGTFDYDILSNEWDLSALEDFGVSLAFDNANDYESLNDTLELNRDTYTISFEFPTYLKSKISKAMKKTSKDEVVDIILNFLGVKR